MILEIIAYVATASAILSYGYMVKTGNTNQYNTINFFAAFPLVAINIMVGAYQGAILSTFYGGVGLWGIIRAWRKVNDELADSNL